MNYKYLFGPVPSRRLGMSLGIDLIPYKTCSLNCVYCECGKTTDFTLERKEYFPFDEIANEIDNFLKNKPRLDFITFSGSGEPTLYGRLGEIIAFIQNNFSDYKIALLTNSTLLKNKELQEEIKSIDLILPSLDAVSEDIFRKVNRPVENISSNDILCGLLEFKKKYKVEMWIELFIIPGLNDSNDELELFREYLIKLNPEKVQLNSMDRPGTENWVNKSSYDNLLRIKDFFKELKVEIIASFNSSTRTFFEKENIESKILSILSRRPCTLEDLIQISSFTRESIEMHLNDLIIEKKIKINNRERGKFYSVIKSDK